ncbi:response regulator transcription factor [Ruminococcus flavefaciens]|uniref:Stage 0 sporulation protein A homolog n=1 Tax=Ruminococcus flavefaciens TaxID=1265 RepID=A0A1K1NEN4_RUMFL|nr:response regulator transcription factor [Ruminococcus flavefaciens]SFW33906.1 DNA-binding response regulator, OmpR family, contains REC and winged-helix (wHTH) domain [Ruminococcus flavefaciens]
MINIENSSILVVDDDHDIVNAIATLLSREGYRIYKAYNGLEAIDSLMQNDIQLILIDVMMPKLDGLSAMMKIRDTKNIPIIVLSAKSEDSDKILGLSMGADDYITKPYNPMELVARVNSNLRRYLSLGAADSVQKGNVVRIGGLVLDRDAKQLSVDGSPVKLTATEYKITELLMSNAGRIFSAEEIYSRVWNEDSYSIENTVMVHIRHIREKIEINPSEPRYLKVVWGIGYKVEKQ